MPMFPFQSLFATFTNNQLVFILENDKLQPLISLRLTRKLKTNLTIIAKINEKMNHLVPISTCNLTTISKIRL